MNINFLIIGGGVAGLSAAIRLAELGQEPLLIEGGMYPAHKVCGEFLSPECLPILKRWHIVPIMIPKAVFTTKQSSLSFDFPSPAGALSHMKLDPALANYASKCGASIKTGTQVLSFQPKQTAKDKHVIHLSSGETIAATHVLIATGRIPGLSTKAPKMAYRGFKAHFKDLGSKNCLEMFSFPGAYLGIAPVDTDTCNIACLTTLEAGHTQDSIEDLIAQHPLLKTRFSKENNLFDRWMIAPVPEFGIKQTPDWMDVYFIGDAAVTIPPASGEGLSMAIFGGQLAAEYALRREPKEFKQMWKKCCSSQVFWARLLHKLMLNPRCGGPLMNLIHYFPSLSQRIFKMTRRT